MKLKDLTIGVPMTMPLAEAAILVSNSVSNKIVDIHTDDYPLLLNDKREAIVFKIDPEGSSYEIARRMVSAINSLDYDSKDVLYALEVENKVALIPDHSAISQEMDASYNVKQEIVGTDGKDYKGQWREYLRYTSVLVGLILPSNK